MIRNRSGLVLAGLLILVLVGTAGAAEITISPSSSYSGSSRIQDAINAATTSDNDTIILSPGIYFEDNILISKNIHIRADTEHGHGPWDTIISSPSDSSHNSIFSDSTGHVFTIDNLTLANTFSDQPSGGSAILSNGGSSIIITSSTFNDCSADGGSVETSGGAITVSGSSLIITSSTFNDCSAIDHYGGNGGAIASYSSTINITSSSFNGCGALDGGAIFAVLSTVSITSSTFTGCTAYSNGGAIMAYTSSLNIITSTFTGCSATGGGAIYAERGSTAIVSSTFTGCPAPGGSVIYADRGTASIRFSRIYQGSTGTAVYGTGCTIDATDNWWGTNAGPAGYTRGTVNTGKWLVLGVTASPASITTDQTSLITANLTYDSEGTDTSAAGLVPDTPISLSGTGGTLSLTKGILVSGIVPTMFTPSSAGTAFITATVDRQSMTVPVTVTTPAAGTNMTSIVIDPAAPATIYAGIDGSGVYRSPDSGSSWTHLTLPTGADLRIRALAPVRLTGSPATTLYAGSYGGGVYRSIDGGANWDNCGTLPNQYVLSLVANSTTGVYAGTESGVYASTDECTNWVALDNGLP